MKHLLSIAAMTSLCAAALLPLPSLAQTQLRLSIDSPAPVRVQHRYDDDDRHQHNSRYQAENRGYAPPPARHEYVPRPRAGYAWQPGHWEWRQTRHHWIGGHWIAERRGHVYIPSGWIERGGRQQFREARWERGRHDGGRNGMPYWRERQDLDRDGVRDGYDRDLDNDGIANRRDRDIDGDGVRNGRDRQPDNRYRY